MSGEYSRRDAFSRLIVFCLLTLTGISSAQAGLVVYGTRFLVTGEKPATGVTVENTGTLNYLVKSDIESAADCVPENVQQKQSRSGICAKKQALIITPPLIALKPGRSNQLLMSCIECELLPQDRESLFRLAVSAIPSGHSGPNSVQIAVRSRFKVFYRPKGLNAADARQAYKKLTWQNRDGHLWVSNPTAYYVTLYELNMNGREVPTVSPLPPYSSRQEDGCEKREECQIEWKTIDDDGRVLPATGVLTKKYRAAEVRMP